MLLFPDERDRERENESFGGYHGIASRDLIKLKNDGYTLIRVDAQWDMRIRYMNENYAWATLEKGFETKVQIENRRRELIADAKVIEC